MYDEWVPVEDALKLDTDVIAAAERTCGPENGASVIYLISGYYTGCGYIAKDVRRHDTDLHFNGISTSKIWAEFLNSLSREFQDAGADEQAQILTDAYTTKQLTIGDGFASLPHRSYIEFMPGQVSPELVIEAMYNLVYSTPFNTQAILEFLEKGEIKR